MALLDKISGRKRVTDEVARCETLVGLFKVSAATC